MKDWNGNSNSTFKVLASNNHCDHDREENDFYATEPLAIEKLMERLKEKGQPLKRVWECACGNGHLSKAMKQAGVEVFSSDIIKRDFECEEIDFTYSNTQTMSKVFAHHDIVTNPPYKYATEFVNHSIDIISDDCRVFMFLKIQFLEGQKRFKEIFSKNPPTNIYVFSGRIVCALNGDFEAMKKLSGSAVCYAWYEWHKENKNKETRIEWL